MITVSSLVISEIQMFQSLQTGDSSISNYKSKKWKTETIQIF